MSHQNRVPMGREVKALRRRLTAEEIGEKARESGKLVQHIVEMKERHRSQKSLMREKEKLAETELKELSNDLASLECTAQVHCRWVVDFNRAVVELVRLDTGGVVQSRPISDDDRQLALEYRLQEADEEELAAIDRAAFATREELDQLRAKELAAEEKAAEDGKADDDDDLGPGPDDDELPDEP